MARVPVILVEVVPTGIGGDKQGAGRELAPLIRKDADVAQMSFSQAETRYRMKLDVQSYKHTRVIDQEARLDIVRGWIKEAQRNNQRALAAPAHPSASSKFWGNGDAS